MEGLDVCRQGARRTLASREPSPRSVGFSDGEAAHASKVQSSAVGAVA